ncbi:hypothetical protein [Aromatoleum toluvorans]|uniref:hypothetical protein n=1 Tax=Aromatoleum toluvorans TaxID=92002 RepID=UPI001FE7036C|nr:hypothetical protein [Aromatoleum toluvorans]
MNLRFVEAFLWVALIDRRERHFRLTNSGNRFLIYAERLLDIQREMKNELGAPESEVMTLRIGGIEPCRTAWGARLLQIPGRQPSPAEYSRHDY